MKNKFLYKLYALLVVLLCTTNDAHALPFIHRHLPPEIKAMCVKFLFAIGGVAIFTIALTIGLSIYNRYFISSQIRDFKLNKDSLRTPRDKEEALLMFITKNRLK